MSKYYLRVEAVNFHYFLDDTDKIQPMRGGSYLLLESINSLEGLSVNGVTLQKIMAGASIGLFSFELKDDSKTDNIIDAVRQELHNQTDGHATFVVNVLKATGTFKHDIETVTAMNRWQQFQQPTLMLPENPADERCPYDGIRPVEGTINTAEGPKNVSSSVAYRTEEGKKLRKKIYKKILDDDTFNEDFTDDLEELSYNPDKGNLHNKIALIYFDGNKFSKIRGDSCNNEVFLRAFSECVEEYRSTFLNKLLEEAKKGDFKNKGKIQIETLLWGGDELEIVVPAWKGWEVLKLFYESMKNAEYKYNKYNGIPLTHAGGIVFTNHKSPIRQLRNIVRNLTDMTKERLPSVYKTLNHGEHDLTHYLIMESFDTVGTDVRRFVGDYYGDGYYDDFVLTSTMIENITNALTRMKKNNFPHNKVFEIVSVVKTDSSAQATLRIEDILKRALSDVEDEDAVKDAINGVIDGKPHRWLMLADLWDYVGGNYA